MSDASLALCLLTAWDGMMAATENLEAHNNSPVDGAPK